MYLVKVEAKESEIDGKGVFAVEHIKKDSIVWKFEPAHDKTLSVEEYEVADEEIQRELYRVAYLSKKTNRLVYPPENDPARYTNHSTQNNLSVLMDDSVSDEPVFIANRDIAAGEELTNNYTEFDNLTGTLKETWIK